MRARWPLALAAALFVLGAAADGFRAWVAATDLPPLALPMSAEVRARDGTLMRAYTVADGRWRMGVALPDVDPGYVAMLVAYEDRRFFDHAGVDPVAMARAVAQALWNGHVVSGGSTLTMQVARLLEESGTGTWAGKLRQMRVAWALEARLSKEEILRLYLHLAPFGGNLEGVRAATFAYFGKEPRRLTPAEAALLVAIPQAPESRRPDRNPQAALEARARVLDRATGDGLIDRDAAAAARTEPVPDARRPFPATAPHLADRLRREDPLAQVIPTTIDAALQLRLERLAAEAVQGGAAQGGADDLQIGIVVADHATGEILASVGSAGFTDDARRGFVDMTQALRSPGSTLKPLVYALAFDDGLAQPETIIDDRPVRFDTYAPQNFDRLFRGEVRLREALQLSLNTPVVQLLDAMGPARLLVALDAAGVTAVVPGGQPGLAVALGGVGISLQDMVQLYATLARGGVALPLAARADGARDEGARVVSAVAAWQVGDILAGLAPPPGSPPNRLAYKTGTSYGSRDAWAIGYDGAHVAGVWMGRADGTPVPGAFGAAVAAPVLFRTFGRIAPDLAPQPAPPPATLMLANPELPPPLRQFRPRDAALSAPGDLALAFPPDGAEVALLPQGLKVRIEGGNPPFTFMVDGTPAVIATRAREALLPAAAGFLNLSVIDATGAAARAEVRVLP